MTVTDADLQLRAEYDATLNSVHTRRSTLHFAHAAICLLIGLIGSATAGKLWWDAEELFIELAIGVGVASLCVLAYSIVRYVLGRKALSFELPAFEKLKRLRQALGLDDPRALLP